MIRPRNSSKCDSLLALRVAVLIGFLLSMPASGQENYAEVMDWYGRLIEAQIPKIEKRIWSNMTAREQRICNDVRFRVIRDDVTNAAAYIDPESGGRVIEIHVGVVRATEIMSVTRAYALINRTSPLPGRYLDYVSKEIDKRRANPVSARDLGNIKSFVRYIDMDERQWKRFRAKREVDQWIEMEMNSSLMWLIGHELAHHFRNHRLKRDVNKQRAQEEEADEIARRLMRRTGYNPIYTVPMLLTFALWEPEAHLREAARTHPAPLTRIEHNIREGATEMLKDEEFRQYLRDTNQEATFHQQIEKDMKSIQQLRLPRW